MTGEGIVIGNGRRVRDGSLQLWFRNSVVDNLSYTTTIRYAPLPAELLKRFPSRFHFCLIIYKCCAYNTKIVIVRVFA